MARDERAQPRPAREAGQPGAPTATTAAAARATAASGITLRPLASHGDYHACYQLQLATWGQDFQEGVPPSVLKISQRVGGVAAGAFDAGGRLLGYVYGLTGVRPPGSRRSVPPPPGGAVRPELLHWSHMLAVAPEARDLGLGTHLKLYQRELLLPLGVEVVEWTYDPLEARNAHLNLNRLGGEVVEYVEEMYQGEMGSDLARGIGTDRFIVAWRIADDHVGAALARHQSGASAEAVAGTGAGDAGAVAGAGAGIGDAGASGPPARFANAPAITPAPAAARAPRTGDAGPPTLPVAPRVRIEVPANVQDFKLEQPERALAWRLLTRQAFQGYLARGYRVTAFWRDAAGRCWYGVEADAS